VAITGALLVGGASERFGSSKSFARIDGETLAERAWRILATACDERIAVGKSADAVGLPFPIVDDGTSVRAPLAGVVAALRGATYEVCVVLPVDCPLVTARLLRRFAAACADAAVPETGPLPGAYRRTALPLLERRLRDGKLALHEALAELDVRRVTADANELVNVNTPEDLKALRLLGT
jgi:molybdopterin-guanine dinucleotide biosynthesis protein A